MITIKTLRTTLGALALATTLAAITPTDSFAAAAVGPGGNGAAGGAGASSGGGSGQGGGSPSGHGRGDDSTVVDATLVAVPPDRGRRPSAPPVADPVYMLHGACPLVRWVDDYGEIVARHLCRGPIVID